MIDEKGLFFIIGSILAAIYPIVTIYEWVYPPDPVAPIFSSWYEALPIVAQLGWSDVIKLSFLYFAPFIVIIIGLAWLIHGVGFLIVKG